MTTWPKGTWRDGRLRRSSVIAVLRQAHDLEPALSRAVWLFAAQQGRAAAAGCDCGLFALAAGRSAGGWRGSQDAVSPAPSRPAWRRDLAALAFKVQTDPYMGRLAYFRVYSGTLRSGAQGLQCQQAKGGADWLSGSNVRRSSRATSTRSRPGTLAPYWGSSSRLPATRCCPRRRSSLLLESISFPDPVISVAIEPRTDADQDKMSICLAAPGRRGPNLSNSI